jgi:hypothetical protein
MNVNSRIEAFVKHLCDKIGELEQDNTALVELNKELVELIGEMNVGYSADIRADELIKRAKELNQ